MAKPEPCNALLVDPSCWPEWREPKYCGEPAEFFCDGYFFCRKHAEALTAEGRKMEPA